MLRKIISLLVLAVVIAGGVFAQTEEKLNKPGGFRAGLVLGPSFGEWSGGGGGMWANDSNPYIGFGFGIFADLRYFKLDLGMNFESLDTGASNNYFVIGGMFKIPIAAGNRLTIAPALGLEYQTFLNDSNDNTRDDWQKEIDSHNATRPSGSREVYIGDMDSLLAKAGLIVDYAISKPLFVRAEILGVFTIVEHRGYTSVGGADIKLGVGYKF